MTRTIQLAALLLFLSACGGTSQQDAGRIYNAAVRAAKHMCRIVDALPDPPADTTSGGEAPTTP